MTSPAERLTGLAPLLEEAHREATTLDQRIAAAQAEAREAFASGDVETGEAALKRAAGLADSGSAVRSRLETLQAAQRALGLEQQHAELRARRDALAQVEREQVEESARRFAQVMPLLRAARRELDAAFAAEWAACRADLDRQHVEVQLGERQQAGSRSIHRRLEGSFDHRLYMIIRDDQSLRG